MQPRNIHVFDGLRITTDHIDHLQGAIHSAIGDVREILGLGQIHRGFAVAVVDNATLEVGPGVAFDRQRRRIVIDEPLRVAVSPIEGSDMRFACLLYSEVADGDVEGKATRVWDSGTVELRPAAPSAAEDTIVLARLVAGTDGSFLVLPARDEEPQTEALVAPEFQPVVAPGLAAAEPLEPVSVSALAVAAIMVDAATLASALEKLAPALRVRAGSPADGPVIRERLTTVEAVAGFPLATVATHGVLALDCEYAPSPSAGGESPANTPAPLRWRMETVMHGHAAMTQTPIGQCAAGTTHVSISGHSDVNVVMSSGCVLRCTAEKAPADDGPDLAFLRGLTAAVEVVARNGDGFGADVWLEWSGVPGDDVVAWLERAKPIVRCGGMLGWSAQPAAGHDAAPRHT